MGKKYSGLAQRLNEMRQAAHLRQLRLEKGLKAQWVADQMGIDSSYLSFLENGRRDWNEELIAKFKKAIGV